MKWKTVVRVICVVSALWMTGCRGVPLEETKPSSETEDNRTTANSSAEDAEISTEETELTQQGEEESQIENYETEGSLPGSSAPGSEPAAVPSEPTPPVTAPSESAPLPTAPPVIGESGELSMEEISQINRLSFASPETGLRHPEDITHLTGAQVRSLIEEYAIPDCAYYNGLPVTEEQKQRLLELRNLEAVAEEVVLQYGVLTENTPVRAFPVMDTMTKDTGVHAFDYLQESMFRVGEGVVVLHQTSDKSFSFVIGENYCGWVQTRRIGFTSYAVFAEWMAGLRQPLTVTARCAVINGRYLRMGTKLPLAAQSNGCFTVKFPVLTGGSLDICLIEVPDDGKVVAGYLPFTRLGVMDQADKLIDMPYGWGDTGANMDCSSTMGAIFATFGIVLPRNSSAIARMGTTRTDVSGMSAAQKEALIRTMQCNNVQPGRFLRS